MDRDKTRSSEKGLNLAKIIPTDILKSGNKDQQKDRSSNWRNEMVQNDKIKFWKQVKTRKVNEII